MNTYNVFIYACTDYNPDVISGFVLKTIDSIQLTKPIQGNNAINLKVFRHPDQQCPRCGYKIKRIIVGQQSTHICPKCQKYKKNH